jgi:hypothetical protein
VKTEAIKEEAMPSVANKVAANKKRVELLSKPKQPTAKELQAAKE